MPEGSSKFVTLYGSVNLRGLTRVNWTTESWDFLWLRGCEWLQFLLEERKRPLPSVSYTWHFIFVFQIDQSLSPSLKSDLHTAPERLSWGRISDVRWPLRTNTGEVSSLGKMLYILSAPTLLRQRGFAACARHILTLPGRKHSGTHLYVGGVICGKELSSREQNTRKGLTGLLHLAICGVAIHADGSEYIQMPLILIVHCKIKSKPTHRCREVIEGGITPYYISISNHLWWLT